MNTSSQDAFQRQATATARDAFQSSATATARDAAGSLYERVKRSSLFGNGILLLAAGFFGLFSGLTLDLQDMVIAMYVLLFGVILCAFATGMSQDTIQKYFGFMYTSDGQLLFLLVAGNLAWTLGVVGIIAAVATNVHGFYAWKSGRGGELPGLASLRKWRRGG